MKFPFRTSLWLLLLSIFCLGSCKNDTEDLDDTFPVEYSASYQIAAGTPFSIQFSSPKNIEELSLLINDSTYKVWKNPTNVITQKFDVSNLGIGLKNLTLKAKTTDGKEYTENQTISILSDILPENLKTEIVQLYPHNPTHFTQGLEIENGNLYESTGDPNRTGATKVMEKELKTDKILREQDLDANYFGEGITIFKNKLYQITWTSQKCFVYDFPSLNKENVTFSYNGEGWGLTHDDQYLIMSDGSNRIFFRDPTTFAVRKTIEVYDNVGPIKELNELEYIDGKIYANVWQTNKIVVIDPQTGKVLQDIDGTDFVTIARGAAGDVLNGIAHDPATGKIYITGKYFDKLGEVKFVGSN